jgi:hypothetical protein
MINRTICVSFTTDIIYNTPDIYIHVCVYFQKIKYHLQKDRKMRIFSLFHKNMITAV